MTTQVAPVKTKLIGTRARRKEDPRLLTGRGTFIDDIKVPGMLEMAVLRSPLPHAEIVSIDTSEALRLPGVFDVVTGAEIAALSKAPMPMIHCFWPGQHMTNHYAMATDKVYYVGQPVAAVAAVDRYVAEDALELIEVEYEDLPAVASLDDALAQRAPKLYPDWPDNTSAHSVIAKGDAAQAFADAEVVVKATLHQGRQLACPLETRGCVASWDPATGELDVWLSSQAPHTARECLGEVFGEAAEKIRVRAPDLGGGFGQKFELYGEEVIAAVLSRRAGRPVKFTEDRLEHFVSSFHAREQRLEMELAATKEGRITGLRAHTTGVWGGVLSGLSGALWFTAISATGPYDIANSEVTNDGVMTNRVPYGGYRGFGQPKANLIHERLIEMLARELQVPSNRLRHLNFVKPDAFPYQAPVMLYDNGRYSDCLTLAEDAVAGAGWEERKKAARADGRSLGIGYSFWVEATAPGPTKALNAAGLTVATFDEEVVRIDATGHVTVHTGHVGMGQGMHTALAQVTAEALEVPLDAVTVVAGDTDSCPYTGYGTGGSRSATTGGAALLAAAGRLKEKMTRIGAHLLEASEEDVVVENGVVSVAGAPDRGVTYAQIADAAYRRPGRISPTTSSSLCRSVQSSTRRTPRRHMVASRCCVRSTERPGRCG
jgi:carbon-monoxide dehydrogenase large subunit